MRDWPACTGGSKGSSTIRRDMEVTCLTPCPWQQTQLNRWSEGLTCPYMSQQGQGRWKSPAYPHQETQVNRWSEWLTCLYRWQQVQQHWLGRWRSPACHQSHLQDVAHGRWHCDNKSTELLFACTKQKFQHWRHNQYNLWSVVSPFDRTERNPCCLKVPELRMNCSCILCRRS